MTQDKTDETSLKLLSLIWPLAAVAGLLVLWSTYWFFSAHALQGRLMEARGRLQAAGWTVENQPFRIEGYPFRMYLNLKSVRILAPDGRGIEAPSLEAEAEAYDLGKWVVNAPTGLIWHRGQVKGEALGTVMITARAICASVSHLGAPAPKAALELVQPDFAVSRADLPFAFKSADRFEAYVRPSEGFSDSADFLWRVSGARGYGATLAGRVAHDQPFDWHIEGRLDNMSRLKALDGARGFADWKASGGAASDLKASIRLGKMTLLMRSPAIGLDPDGSLRGHADLELTGQGDGLRLLQDMRLLSEDNALLAHSLIRLPEAVPDHPARLGLDFHDGGTWFGPVRLSQAPHIP